MNYTFEADSWGADFSLPVAVVNNYIKKCSEVQLKVLLCIFSGPRKNSSAMIAEQCGAQVSQVEQAVAFWNSTGLISVSCEDGSALPEVSSQPAQQVEAVTPTRAPQDKRVVVRYSQREMQQMAQEDKQLKELIDQIQANLQFTINGSELSKLIELYEYYHFDVPSIMLAAQYCAGAGKRSIAYLHKVMIRWYEQDITSFENIEQEMIRSNERRSYERKVLSVFGVSDKPSKKQKEYMEKWLASGFSIELLEIAYDKCMNRKNKLSFGYIDGILSKWAQGGIDTPEKVRQSDEAFRSKKTQADLREQPSYDIDEFESFALNHRLDYSGKDKQ